MQQPFEVVRTGFNFVARRSSSRSEVLNCMKNKNHLIRHATAEVAGRLGMGNLAGSHLEHFRDGSDPNTSQ